MSYFVISNLCGDGVLIEKLTREQLLGALQPGSSTDKYPRIDPEEIVLGIPNGMVEWRGRDRIIIKGKVVVPQPANGWTIE